MASLITPAFRAAELPEIPPWSVRESMYVWGDDWTAPGLLQPASNAVVTHARIIDVFMAKLPLNNLVKIDPIEHNNLFLDYPN